MGYPSNKFFVYSKNSTKTNPSSLTHSVLIEQIAPNTVHHLLVPSLLGYWKRMTTPQIPSLCANNFIFTGFYSIFCVASNINNFAK